jgi:uncharacterized pyridoxamine 5'-phosphate oxidase family protein
MSASVIQKISDYLKNHEYIQLATVDEEQQPHVRTVSVVSKGAVVYFMTDKWSRKVKHFGKNPKVGYVMDEEYKDWTKIQGIQMQGIAEQVTDGKEMQEVMQMFFEKYPLIKNMPQEMSKGMVCIKIKPVSGIFIDNTVQFGYREQVDF